MSVTIVSMMAKTGTASDAVPATCPWGLGTLESIYYCDGILLTVTIPSGLTAGTWNVNSGTGTSYNTFNILSPPTNCVWYLGGSPSKSNFNGKKVSTSNPFRLLLSGGSYWGLEVNPSIQHPVYGELFPSISLRKTSGSTPEGTYTVYGTYTMNPSTLILYKA